jgi:deoxyribose-phosphate aldolase
MSQREQDPTLMNLVLARRLVAHLDLTDLREAFTQSALEQLAARATTPFGLVAGVCVRPAAAAALRPLLPAGVRLVVVANFPDGEQAPHTVLEELRAAVANGADEIDLVYPYRAAQRGDLTVGPRLVAAAAQEVPFLKVILETAAWSGDPVGLLGAARAAMGSGAAMLKSSTGDPALERATLGDLSLLAEAITDHSAVKGLKVSGGVDLAFATAVVTMAERMLGPELTPARFRIGASRLVEELSGVATGDRY